MTSHCNGGLLMIDLGMSRELYGAAPGGLLCTPVVNSQKHQQQRDIDGTGGGHGTSPLDQQGTSQLAWEMRAIYTDGIVTHV